jgi:hypothetical protein
MRHNTQSLKGCEWEKKKKNIMKKRTIEGWSNGVEF